LTKALTHPLGVAIILLLCLCTAVPAAYAATNDAAYNACLQELDHDPSALISEVWEKKPLPLGVQREISPNLFGDTVIRWVSHKNLNGTVSFSILTRDPEPQPVDDPDGFFIILQAGTHYSIAANVAANAFSFSKNETNGVNGLLFCTHGDISNEWVWDGKAWK
jgi:hypothetical protein